MINVKNKLFLLPYINFVNTSRSDVSASKVEHGMPLHRGRRRNSLRNSTYTYDIQNRVYINTRDICRSYNATNICNIFNFNFYIAMIRCVIINVIMYIFTN